MGDLKDKLRKVGTLGGRISINPDTRGYYFGNSQGLSKEKLFGKAAQGPLLIGMPQKKEMAMSSVGSDTSADLTRELMDKGLTREEAVKTIKELLKEEALVEVYDPDLRRKVLVWGRGSN